MKEDQKVVVFSAGNEEFGVPVLNVISIERAQRLNAIPQMPNYMLGVLTIREELVPIVDTGIILFNKSVNHTDKTKIIVVKTDTLSVGLLVDDAKEIIDIPQNQVKPLNVTYQLSSYITGVATLEGRLITLLDPHKLFYGLEGFERIEEHIHSHH
ncbi:purine-binding chemotaxis protein CheW [Bacillus timonensis]|uniref:Purine-binding chemotaxis protein CheW n=1 Tax=Bacillus timonensis TaxID=1033734 RepID=A0A4S3Q0Q1_9BACI|nr:chemotaxis protein CheW [Bacillus timonensis]THE14972.1 purine-binding chemotaxis protein CheW [Bacillus timonensis]